MLKPLVAVFYALKDSYTEYVLQQNLLSYNLIWNWILVHVGTVKIIHVLV